MKLFKKLLILALIVLFVFTPAFATVGDTVAKTKLSGSTDGKMIKITGVDTANAIVVHTATAGTTNFDEVWIWIFNAHTAAVEVNIEWGVHADAADLIKKTIPKDDGFYLAIPGLILQNGMTVEIFATTTADVLFVIGYVNRMTE